MKNQRNPIIRKASEGRLYKLGANDKTEVLFKADGSEVDHQYAITEWWIDQGGPGPDPHLHVENDELIYVLAGPVSILIGEEWKEHQKGSLVIVPAGIQHTFVNNSEQRIGVLNILLDAAYEAMMPQITKLFASR